LPRCFSMRAVKSNWAGLENIFDFSVESDFADGRYPEYLSSAPVPRELSFEIVREVQPEFDGSIRMNNESPFRITILVLTVACILSGVTAASYLAALSSPRSHSDEQISVAANLLQMSLLEFQTSGRKEFSQIHQPTAALRQTLFAASSPEPVTVHPVTVNIDNSGIIREISRIHERLDLLSNEAGWAVHPMAPTPDASTVAPVQHTDAQQTGSKFEYQVHDETPTEEPASLPAIEFSLD